MPNEERALQPKSVPRHQTNAREAGAARQPAVSRVGNRFTVADGEPATRQTPNLRYGPHCNRARANARHGR